MKTVNFSLFLLVSSLTGREAQNNIFKAEKVYTYDVTSTFWPNSDSSQDTSAVEECKVKYLLNVTAVEPNKFILQTGTYQLYKGNKVLKQIPISPCVQNELETAVEVTLDSKGQLISVTFQHSLSEQSMNIKKFEVYRFILNTEISIYYGIGNKDQLEYVVEEESIMGQCEVKYIVHEEQKSLLSPRSNSMSKNSMSDETKTEFMERQPADNTSKIQQQPMKTSSGQLAWSSYVGDEFHNVDSMRRFCDTNSKIYEFQKTIDLRYCQSTGNFEKPEVKEGIIQTQYITCGLHRECITVLQIFNQIPTENKRVDQMTLVDISDMKSKVPSFKNATEQFTNFYISSFGSWYDFLTDACNDIEKSNPAELRKRRNQDDVQIQKFRDCIRRSVVHSRKLVLRDLRSDHYNNLNLQWNLRKEKVYPLAYFLPTTVQDVAKAVKCGLDTETRLVPTSGGHSYEAIGYGDNTTVIVDFTNMNKTNVEGSGPHAIGRIESGALVGPINAYFWENGGYALPMGSCMTVGIGGHAIGGGTGFFSQQYGLTIDHVIEYECVDSRGKIIIANQNVNSDLFWALRGVGSGYIAIVTAIKVKLFEAHKIKITRVRVYYRTKHFARAYIAFQNMLKWINANEPTIFLGFILTSDATKGNHPLFHPGIKFTALHIQDPTVQPKENSSFLKSLFKIFLNPDKIIQDFPNYIQHVGSTGLIRDFKPPQLTTKEQMQIPRFNAELYDNSYKTRLMNLTGDDEYISFIKSIPPTGGHLVSYLKVKSFFVKKYFTLAQMRRVAHVLRKMPPNTFWIQCNTEQGVVHRVGKNETSYVHRDSILSINIQYAGPSDPVSVEGGMTFLYELWNVIRFMDGGETYQNLVDFDVQDYLARYYGQNLNKLIEQKQKWDPNNFFEAPLSLPNLPKNTKFRELVLS